MIFSPSSPGNASILSLKRVRGFLIGMVIAALFLAGCVAGGKAPIIIDQYIFEYPSPAFEGLSPLNEVVSVGRFAVAQAFNTPMMVYRTKPFEYYVDYYNRWRVNPGDMVTDYLLRDIKRTGLFKAVFSYRDAEDVHFSIQGSVEDFLQAREKGTHQARLTVYISLLDMTQKDVTRKVVFQKRYHYIQPLEDDTAASFARGMSQAMGAVSKEAIKDIYTAAGRGRP